MNAYYTGIEFGMAEKLVMRAISIFADKPIRRVAADFRYSGDLGDVAAKRSAGRVSAHLTLKEVFERLREIAAAKGADSQETKLLPLAQLLQECFRPRSKVRSAHRSACAPPRDSRNDFALWSG